MKAFATIRVRLPSEKHVKIILEALKPETRSAPSKRSKTFLNGEGNTVVLRFEARDTTALRASINSYLRWINQTVSILEYIKILSSAD